ncbi:MAG TPA: hypothetical protein VJ875_19030 [Pyrinomonadaceae bacterium]|nr:hypothetical protein [Pyrinomonadaceae bacterium]
MNIRLGVLAILMGLFLLTSTSANAQSCNPAAVSYIVRDEQGSIIGGEELKALHQQLPKIIGNADISVGEVSFASDGVTLYRRESVDWDKGNKVPALEFVNAKTCTLNFPGVDLTYHGKKMSLIFNITIDRSQHDRRPVIDSLPFEEGTFVLDLTSWPRNEDKMIPVTLWKKSKAH